MKRLRFYVDITVNDETTGEYKHWAWVLEDAIRKTRFDLVNATFYLGSVKVLRKQPRRPPQ